MLVKALGAIDLISGVMLIFGMKAEISKPIFIVLGILLLIKAMLGMFKDFASWIDATAGIIFLLSTLFSIPGAILVLVGILSLQKGIFSFL